MEKIRTKIDELLKKPEDYLRPVASFEAAWREQLQRLYNFTKKQEDHHSLPVPPTALHSLPTDSLDLEQIWQLVDLQTGPLLEASDDVSSLSDLNLCLSVARLSSLTKLGKMTTLDMPGEDEGIGASSDEGVRDDSEGDDEDMEDDDDDEDMDDEDMKDDDSNDYSDDVDSIGGLAMDDSCSDEEGTDQDEDDLLDRPLGFNEAELDDHFSDNSDNEVDNFDDLIAPEGQESDDTDEEQTQQTPTPQNKCFLLSGMPVPKENTDSDEPTQGDDKDDKKDKGSEKKFKKTSVDTKFFKLRESEWIADTDAIGENFQDGPDDDIDLMTDMLEGDEDEEEAMYAAFFDEAPEDGQKKKKKKLSEMLDGDEDDDYDEEEEDDDVEEEERREEETQGMEEGRRPLLGTQKKETKSRFELEREKELAIMGQLEDDNIGEKPWYLRGEASSAERPEDSALQQNLDYNIAVRQKPVITEDTTTLVERVIMSRIKSGAWDDVERKVKRNVDPIEYKKKLLLDQDKSKKSLAEIYEEEYVKQQAEKKGEENEEEPEEHHEIRKLMDNLFTKLDALSNYHYTPAMPTADIKIQSNLAAITVEEATPDTATSATLLAPQEILEPVRGELTGKTERTDTDRKRERRTKKVRQGERAKKQNRQLAEKLKRIGKGGPGEMDKKTTTRVIQKAVKAGHVKMLEGSGEKSVTSSQLFFKKLQENATNTKKDPNTKKKKADARPQHSISKLML